MNDDEKAMVLCMGRSTVCKPGDCKHCSWAHPDTDYPLCSGYDPIEEEGEL